MLEWDKGKDKDTVSSTNYIQNMGKEMDKICEMLSEETKDFDFSARVHPKQISDEYKDSLRKLKNMHLSTNEIYEKIENKSWEDLTRKERDSFRHIVKRACKKSI